MTVSMTATKGFANPRITGPRPDGAVVPGERFTTDWLHGRELRRLGLAEPEDAAAFEAEPAEALKPSNQVSDPELRRINARRAAAAAKAGAAAPAPTAPVPDLVAPVVPAPGARSNAPAIPPAPAALAPAAAPAAKA